MAHGLGAWPALAEDSGWIPSTYMVASSVTPVPRTPTPGLHGHLILVVHNIYRHIKVNYV